MVLETFLAVPSTATQTEARLTVPLWWGLVRGVLESSRFCGLKVAEWYRWAICRAEEPPATREEFPRMARWWWERVKAVLGTRPSAGHKVEEWSAWETLLGGH